MTISEWKALSESERQNIEKLESWINSSNGHKALAEFVNGLSGHDLKQIAEFVRLIAES